MVYRNVRREAKDPIHEDYNDEGIESYERCLRSAREGGGKQTLVLLVVLVVIVAPVILVVVLVVAYRLGLLKMRIDLRSSG